MIVDNETGLLVLFGNLVRRLGYQVLQAEDGSDALDLLAEHTPDVLVLDLAMPGVSGFDVLRGVVAMPHLDGMRVLVLTATGPGPAPADVAFRINKWLTKPVRPDAFNAVLGSLVENADTDET